MQKIAFYFLIKPRFLPSFATIGKSISNPLTTTRLKFVFSDNYAISGGIKNVFATKALSTYVC